MLTPWLPARLARWNMRRWLRLRLLMRLLPASLPETGRLNCSWCAQARSFA